MKITTKEIYLLVFVSIDEEEQQLILSIEAVVMVR